MRFCDYITICALYEIKYHTPTKYCNICLQHKRLSNHIYNMTWYDMPNKNKQLIVIMFQRTQRDLTLSSALFSSERASRSLISKVIKQVYTILNVLLKT